MGERNDPAGVLCQLSNPRTRLRYQRPSIAFCHDFINRCFFVSISSFLLASPLSSPDLPAAARPRSFPVCPRFCGGIERTATGPGCPPAEWQNFYEAQVRMPVQNNGLAQVYTMWQFALRKLRRGAMVRDKTRPNPTALTRQLNHNYNFKIIS